jgi:hypothetical protein
MKLTPILYVRSWIAKLHPPMPTTPRENKQLLSLLNSSFQRQLDDAHPPVQPTVSTPQLTVSASESATDNVSARATMDHLQSLLHHPLLAQSTAYQTEIKSGAARAATMMDQAMRRGRAGLEMVAQCMQVYLKILQNGNTAIKEEYRLGGRISAWFTSSDSATKERFLSSPGLLRNAVPILYADGLEEVVWEWLGMLYSRKAGVDNSHNATEPVQWVLHQSHLTFLMIKEALRRSRLDSAVLQFIQACGYMRQTGQMPSEIRSSEPWQAATKAITIALLRRRHQHGLSAHLFDSLLERRSSWSDQNTLTFELISLYHPNRPSAKELASVMGQDRGRIQAQFDQIKVMSEPAQKIVLNALLDGAQLLLKQDPSSVQHTRLILDLVEQQFPNTTERESNGATQKRIQSARQTLTPHTFMPAPIAIT